MDDVASNWAGTFVLVLSGQWRLLDDSDSLPLDVLALLDRFDDLEDDVVTGSSLSAAWHVCFSGRVTITDGLLIVVEGRVF